MTSIARSISLFLRPCSEVLYLDDSGSMHGANLTEAQGALRQMAHLLQRRVRVCTFGASKQVILPRRPTEEPLGRSRGS